MLTLPDSHKFGIVAMQNVAADVTNGLTFANGTVIFTSISDWVNSQWRRWIGELRAQDLEQCNLIIFRHAHRSRPEVLDAEHEALSREANAILILTAYQFAPWYESAWSIRGSIVNGQREVRQMGRIPDLYRTQGSDPQRITDQTIEYADKTLPDWLAVRASGQFHRFRLSMGMVLNGLRESYGEERVHQYARALEGLILPKIGATEKQFVHRCLTFVGASDKNRQIMRDIFRMRSATEHLHSWDTAVQDYPVEEREITALLRTRQAEQLAAAAVLRILTTPSLRTWFEDDARISEFWLLKDHERSSIWGAPFRLQDVL